VPGLLLIATDVYRFAHPLSYWSRPAWSLTDWVNHGEMVVDLAARGLLDYRLGTFASGDDVVIYPRGLHALLAWLVDAGMTDGSVTASWVPTITGLFVVAAGITALVFVSAALVSLVVAVRMGLPSWMVVAAPLVTAALFLHGSVYQMLADTGFITTAMAALIAFGVVLVSDAGDGSGRYAYRLSLVLLLLIGMLHVWQLLVPPVGVAAAVLAYQWWRAGRRHAMAIGILAAVVVAASLPLVLVTLTSTGVSQTRMGVSLTPFQPWVVLVVCSLAIACLLIFRPRPIPLVPVIVGMAASSLALGVALIPMAGGTIDEVPYYAGKLLWNAVVLCLPVALAGVGWLLLVAWRSDGLARVSRGRTLTRVLIMGAPIVLLLAYAGGGFSYGYPTSVRALTDPSGAGPQVPLSVLDHPEMLGQDGTPVLVWLLHPQGWQLWLRNDDWQASQVLRTLGRPIPLAGTLLGHRATEACDWLRENPTAMRITGPRLGYAELIRRGCPEDVVRPDQWKVIVTPPEWWKDTEWDSTGGAPDPRITSPDALFRAIDGQTTG